MKKYRSSSKSKSAIMKHFILTAIFAAMCQHGAAQTNTPPTITGTPVSGIEGSDYIFAPIGSDTDAGDTLTYSVSGQPDWLTIVPATGVLTGKPSYTDAGTSAIVITVNDETTNATLSVDIVIADFNFPIHAGAISKSSTIKLDGAIGIAVLGDYAYVASQTDNAVEILDISDPTIDPVHAGSIKWTNTNGVKLRGASDIAVVERTVNGAEKIYAYVASSNSDAVSVLDVTTPATPTQVGSITNGFDADGTTANTAVKLDRAVSIEILGDYAYVGSQDSNAIQILDISNPIVLVHAGSITDDATTKLSSIFGITVAEKTVGGVTKVYVYVASQEDLGSVEILDVTTPGAITHVGSISDNDEDAQGNTNPDVKLSGATSIKIVGDYAYVTSYTDGVEILDISDPANPVHVSSVASGATGTKLRGARDIAVVGNYAYVASNTDDAVEILDISDPANPIHAGYIVNDSTTKLDGAIGITVVGNYAYVTSNTDDGVEVLQISEIVRSGNLILGDQVAIDGLSSSLTRIAGNLIIRETGTNTITSLTSLSNIISIGGNLEIVGNASLTSLAGLEDLAVLEGKLYIGITAADAPDGNAALVDFCAISNLVTGTAQITNVSGETEYFVGNNEYNPSYAGLAIGTAATTDSG